MAVSGTIVSHSYKPGAAMAAEALTGMEFDGAADLLVTHVADATGAKTVLSEGTHYTIGGSPSTAAGTITALAAWPIDDLFLIERKTPRTQVAEFDQLELPDPKAIEAALDRATKILQEVGAEAAAAQAQGDAALAEALAAKALGQALAALIGSSVSPVTALAAISVLIPAANRVPYYTSGSAAGLLTFSDDETLASATATMLASARAIKAYIDAQTNLKAWKNPVRVAATANVNLAAPGATIDGVAMAAGDRFLAPAQTTASQNGIYVWNGAAVAATRAADADSGAELVNAVVEVSEGTNADTMWACTTNAPITVGTTGLTWGPATSGGVSFASSAEVRAGTVSTKAVAPNTLAQANTPQAISQSGANLTWDVAAAPNAVLTITANITSVTISNAQAGMVYGLEVVQGGSGGYTIAGWPAAVDWGNAGAPTLSTAVGKVDLISMRGLNNGKLRSAMSKG